MEIYDATKMPKMTASQYEVVKSFHNYPCSHRRHRHQGHCANVHGYSRSFTFVFRATWLDSQGFVIDFGQLGNIKEFLEENFDHTLLLDSDDPIIPFLAPLVAQFNFAKVITFREVGMEGTAKWLHEQLNPGIIQENLGRVWIHQIEVRENDKNAARLTFPMPTMEEMIERGSRHEPAGVTKL